MQEKKKHGKLRNSPGGHRRHPTTQTCNCTGDVGDSHGSARTTTPTATRRPPGHRYAAGCCPFPSFKPNKTKPQKKKKKGGKKAALRHNRRRIAAVRLVKPNWADPDAIGKDTGRPVTAVCNQAQALRRSVSANGLHPYTTRFSPPHRQSQPLVPGSTPRLAH